MRISAYLHTIRGYSIISRGHVFIVCGQKLQEKNEAKENEHENL